MIITPDDIRGLTLWRPWPWTFTHADKRVENRPKPPPRHMCGRWLALHSGLKFDNDACEAMQGGEYGETARGCPSSTVYHPESVITCVAQVSRWYELDKQFRVVSVGGRTMRCGFGADPLWRAACRTGSVGGRRRCCSSAITPSGGERHAEQGALGVQSPSSLRRRAGVVADAEPAGLGRRGA